MTERTVQPTVLLYHISDPARLARVRGWLERAGVRALELAPTELNQSLGALLGLPGFAREPGLRLGGGPTEEMLVMFAFRGDLLNSFLAFFREEGLAPVALKAMVTPINVHWSALRLHEALREEHAQLRAAAKQKERDHT